MDVENTLKAMGLELPAAGTPPPGRAGAVKIGNILFVGGHTPGPAYVGKLGAGFTVEQGYDGARQACLNCLADVKAVLGDLDNEQNSLLSECRGEGQKSSIPMDTNNREDSLLFTLFAYKLTQYA